MTVPTSWRISPVSFAAARALAVELGVSDTLAQVLVRRGFTDPDEARAFLHPDFRVHNPYLHGGHGRGPGAHRPPPSSAREPIAVHGDYDADGITATFLLVDVPARAWAPTCAGGCPTASPRATASPPRTSTSWPPPA